jgi:hypothetical protein
MWYNMGSLQDGKHYMLGRCNMNFGSALHGLKDGAKLAREGWNGKGMFIYLVTGTTVKSSQLRGAALDHVAYQGVREGEDFDPLVVISSHIDMKAADGSITVGWNPSQIDMLAEDWTTVV